MANIDVLKKDYSRKIDQISLIAVFFGRFCPQPDITAYELTLIEPWHPRNLTCLWETIPDEVKRHFEMERVMVPPGELSTVFSGLNYHGNYRLVRDE